MNHQNRIMMALTAIAATIQQPFSRIKQAKAVAYQKLGMIPQGFASHKHVCPKGAGQGPVSHSFEQQKKIGSRRFTRQQAKMVRDLKHGWGKNFE